MYMARDKNNKEKIYLNHSVRYKGKKVAIFDRINLIKKDLKELIPEIEEEKFLSMLSHIRNFFYGKSHYGRRAVPENLERKRELTTNEKIVLDYLLKTNLNPSTTYRWFIACRIPSDLKDKLQDGKISYRKAYAIASNRKKSRLSNTGLLMIEEINNAVRSL